MDLKQIPQIHSESGLQQFLNRFEAGLKVMHEQISRLHFKQLVEKAIVPELAELHRKQAAILHNPRFEELIHTWVSKVEDPVLKRRLFIWKNGLLEGKVNHHPEVMEVTRQLSDAMVTYKYQVAGEPSDLGTIKQILRTSPDATLRKDAWYARFAISESLAPRLLTLFQLRNDLAKEAGYNTMTDLILEMDGLTLADVRKMLTELTVASDPVYKTILREGQEQLGIEQVEPWDLMYLLETMGGVDPALFPKTNIAPKLKSWASDHGCNLESLGIEMVCTDIPYNGLCMTLADQEIKILSNPSDGHGSYRTMFHELGHALHSAYNRQDARSFHQDSGPFTEGMAELIAYVTRHADWLTRMGLKANEVQQIQKRLIAPVFHYLRERTAYALAEYLIYEDLTKDPDTILMEMEHEVLGITRHATPRWAASAWYINYPIYWQNYVLADMVASQIHHRLDEQFGGLHGQPEALAEVIRIYFAPGSSVDWQEKLLHHTGSKLCADALVKDLQFYLEG